MVVPTSGLDPVVALRYVESLPTGLSWDSIFEGTPALAIVAATVDIGVMGMATRCRCDTTAKRHRSRAGGGRDTLFGN